jgi:hypothetical protein
VSWDPTTPAGQVRLLISDVDRDHPIFAPDEIDAFLTLEGGDVRLAAAQALDTIASNEAMVSKRIRLLDLSTDGPAVAKALRDHAGRLRDQAETAGEDAGFDVAEMVTTQFSWREQVR